MNINKHIFCAIDFSDINDAISKIKIIKNEVGGVKLGLEFFIANGLNGVNKIREFGLPIFLDLKLHDIPNTVKKSLRNILSLKPKYTTLHVSGGSDMIEACISLKREVNSKTNLIGVTVLTSFDDDSLNKVGIHESLGQHVENLTKLAFNCGIDGIVCSPHEIERVKETYGSKLKLIVPGIRNNADRSDDQKRTLSAREAIDLGADVIVIGRPITSAESPAIAAKTIYHSLK